MTSRNGAKAWLYLHDYICRIVETNDEICVGLSADDDVISRNIWCFGHAMLIAWPKHHMFLLITTYHWQQTEGIALALHFWYWVCCIHISRQRHWFTAFDFQISNSEQSFERTCNGHLFFTFQHFGSRVKNLWILEFKKLSSCRVLQSRCNTLVLHPDFSREDHFLFCVIWYLELHQCYKYLDRNQPSLETSLK